MKWSKVIYYPPGKFVEFLKQNSLTIFDKDEDRGDFFDAIFLDTRNRRQHEREMYACSNLLRHLFENPNNFGLTQDKQIAIFFKALKLSCDSMILIWLLNNIDEFTITDIDGKTILDIGLEYCKAEAAQWCLTRMKQFIHSLRPIDREKLLSNYRDKFADDEDIIKIITEINNGMTKYEKYRNLAHGSVEALKELEIMEHFNEFGKVGFQEIALILEAKRKSASSTFIINRDRIPVLIDSILKILTSPTREQHYKWQVYFYQEHHSSYGEICIDKSCNPPKLKILSIDPALGVEITRYFIGPHLKELSKVANVTLYSSNDLIQKSGFGCTFFAAEGTSLLANQQQYGDIYEFMEKHGQAETVCGIKHIKSPVHPRLKRSSHVFDNLKSTVIDVPEFAILEVNKHKDTAAHSILRDIKPVEDKIHNGRLDRKRKNYAEKVGKLFDSKQVKTQGDLAAIIAKRDASALQQFCEKQIVAEQTLGTKIIGQC